MDSLASRLKIAREAAGLTQGELAVRAGYSGQSAIEAIEAGRSTRPTRIHEIAKACGVTVEWLQGREEGAPLKHRIVADEPKRLRISLAPGHQRVIHDDEAPKGIPEYDIRAGASYAGGRNDRAWNDESGWQADEPVERWGLPSSYVERELGLSYNMSGILPIRGDSMDDGSNQALVSGDRVIIDQRDTDVRQGGIFAVFDGDGVIIKQVELLREPERVRIVCKSLNQRYSPIELDLQLPVKVIGRVAGVISRR